MNASDYVGEVSGGETATLLGVRGDDLVFALTLDVNGEWRIFKGSRATVIPGENSECSALRQIESLSVTTFAMGARVCRWVRMPDGSLRLICIP